MPLRCSSVKGKKRPRDAVQLLGKKVERRRIPLASDCCAKLVAAARLAPTGQGSGCCAGLDARARARARSLVTAAARQDHPFACVRRGVGARARFVEPVRGGGGGGGRPDARAAAGVPFGELRCDAALLSRRRAGNGNRGRASMLLSNSKLSIARFCRATRRPASARRRRWRLRPCSSPAASRMYGAL